MSTSPWGISINSQKPAKLHFLLSLWSTSIYTTWQTGSKSCGCPMRRWRWCKVLSNGRRHFSINIRNRSSHDEWNHVAPPHFVWSDFVNQTPLASDTCKFVFALTYVWLYQLIIILLTTLEYVSTCTYVVSYMIPSTKTKRGRHNFYAAQRLLLIFKVYIYILLEKSPTPPYIW